MGSFSRVQPSGWPSVLRRPFPSLSSLKENGLGLGQTSELIYDRDWWQSELITWLGLQGMEVPQKKTKCLFQKKGQGEASNNIKYLLWRV